MFILHAHHKSNCEHGSNDVPPREKVGSAYLFIKLLVLSHLCIFFFADGKPIGLGMNCETGQSLFLTFAPPMNFSYLVFYRNILKEMPF